MENFKSKQSKILLVSLSLLTGFASCQSTVSNTPPKQDIKVPVVIKNEQVASSTSVKKEDDKKSESKDEAKTDSSDKEVAKTPNIDVSSIEEKLNSILKQKNSFNTKSINGSLKVSGNIVSKGNWVISDKYIYAQGFENKNYSFNFFGLNVYAALLKSKNGQEFKFDRFLPSGLNFNYSSNFDFDTFAVLFLSNKNASFSAEIKEQAAIQLKGIRNADPYNKYVAYDSGITTSALKSGNASHNLSPAELVYYSSKENNINPLLLLAKLQDEQSLITKGKDYADFERRLLRATGYGALDSGDNPKWYGFFPQVVSATLKLSDFRKNGYTFDNAYKTYTTGAGKYDGFISNIYPVYAAKMNSISGKNYSTKPTSSGYYNDFRDISISNIQSFLDSYPGALKETDLFRQEVKNSSVAY